MRSYTRWSALFSALLLLPIADSVPTARAKDAPAIAGLSAPVTILTDDSGIPHVRAATLADLYAGWGYVTARDRMWQLALTRAQAQGLAHRWLGNASLQSDGGAQLFRLAERAAAIWQRDRADAQLRECIERYTDGINARMDECRRGDAEWPAELTQLRATPEPWRPEDSVLMLLVMGITLDLDLPELHESESIGTRGRKADTARRRFEDRLMFRTIPDSVAGTHTSVALLSPAGAHAGHALPAGTLALARPAAALYANRADDGSDRASNQMVVARGRSASGAPLLANDPHLALTTPGAFHVVHLSLPGVVEAIGAAVPGLPIIASGRNRDCAWGVTALSADVVDAYADTLSADGRRARGARGWENVIEKPFDLRYRVLGLQLPIPAFVQSRRYTSHGPVVVFDKKNRVAITARWSAMEDSRISLARLVGLERSRSAAEIAERVRTLVTPCFNVVAADRAGNSVYQTAGLLPERGFTFERGVLPSDGRHEWRGFVPADRMPAWTLGERDFAANGNNLPGGTGRDWARFDWAHDRAARMAQRLAGDTRVTRADLASVQNDVVSLSAQRTSPLLVELASFAGGALSPRAKAALDTLRGWDFSMRRTRVAPTLNRSWWNCYLRRSGFEGYPGLALAALSGEAAGELKSPAGEPETPPQAALAALEMALDTLTAKLGPDMSAWKWGAAHRARFVHALSAQGASARARFEPPYTPEDGDGSTPSVGGTRAPFHFDVRHGPCYRHVVDLADSVTSLGVVPPWNSERRREPAMRDEWARHGYVRFDLDWDRVSAAATETLTLQSAAPRR
ncbi:MAG: penicillin acylase family protein [Candidatus Eisenbacteria bacterium]|nr:penicillin acylase family protein [Candidatus Eisenbacteria bacterium]